MNGAALPSMMGTSGEFSSTIDVVDAQAHERGQQVLDGLDGDRVAGEAGSVVDAADVLDGCRYLEASQVGAAESDAGAGGSGLERQGDLAARMETNTSAGNGSTQGPLCVHQAPRSREMTDVYWKLFPPHAIQMPTHYLTACKAANDFI